MEGGEGREGERYYSRAKMAIFHVCGAPPHPPPPGEGAYRRFSVFQFTTRRRHTGLFQIYSTIQAASQGVCRRHVRIPGFYHVRAGCVATYPAHSIRVMAMVLQRWGKPALFFTYRVAGLVYVNPSLRRWFAAPTPTLPHGGREHIGAFLFFGSLHEDAILGYFKFIPPYKQHYSVCRRHARIPGFYRMRASCVATYPAHSIRVMAMVLRRRSKLTLYFYSRSPKVSDKARR